jgi:hypothetical protein
MPISRKYNLIFIHIPKNAGTSITKAFKMDHAGHRTVKQTKKLYPKVWDSFHKFCIVRNPLHRFISCYEYAKEKDSYYHSSNKKFKGVGGKHPDYDLLSNKTFDECIELFLKNKLLHWGWLPQSYWVCEKKRFALDQFIKIEELPETLMGVKLPFLNKSKKNKKTSNKIDSYYNEESLDKIKRIYQSDFKLFNYK